MPPNGYSLFSGTCTIQLPCTFEEEYMRVVWQHILDTTPQLRPATLAGTADQQLQQAPAAAAGCEPASAPVSEPHIPASATSSVSHNAGAGHGDSSIQDTNAGKQSTHSALLSSAPASLAEQAAYLYECCDRTPAMLTNLTADFLAEDRRAMTLADVAGVVGSFTEKKLVTEVRMVIYQRMLKLDALSGHALVVGIGMVGIESPYACCCMHATRTLTNGSIYFKWLL